MPPIRILIGTIAAILLTGCTLFNVSVLSPPQELEEKVLEGKGPCKILLVDVSGFISEKESEGGLLSRRSNSSVSVVREALKKAESDDRVVGLIIRVNSPGGTVTASDTIYHDIRSFKQRTKVPVYACITGIGASGGYYLATAADRISAHPAAVTGSIGVLFMKFGVEGLLSKVGVTEQTFKSADKKDIMSPFRPSTPEEERIMQGIIDSFADRFIDVVLARPNNRLSKEELKKLADGRIYTSDQAVRAGLIDGVEYLDDSVAAMKRKLGLEEAKVVTYFRPGSYRGSIYSEAGAESRSLGIININAGGLEMLAGPQFLYLWKP